MQPNDYYATLGVDRNADQDAIKEAFRHLAFKYHPDRNKDDSSTADKMKAVNEAYAVLSDPQKRREYDAMRERFGTSAHDQFRRNYTEQDIFSGSDINHIFEEMARSFGLRGGNEIFRDFYGPGYRSFEFKRPGFRGRGFIYSGKHPGRRNSPLPFPGMKPLSWFSKFILQRIGGAISPQSGTDVHDVIYLQPEFARQGGPYPYLHRRKNKKLVIKVPPGIREGQQIRLSGMGNDGSHGALPGDLYLKITIRRPLIERVKQLADSIFKPKT
jgi:DnaJ-class molecular chaperone